MAVGRCAGKSGIDIESIKQSRIRIAGAWPKETLENPARLHENGAVIGGQNWVNCVVPPRCSAADKGV